MVCFCSSSSSSSHLVPFFADVVASRPMLSLIFLVLRVPVPITPAVLGLLISLKWLRPCGWLRRLRNWYRFVGSLRIDFVGSLLENFVESTLGGSVASPQRHSVASRLKNARVGQNCSATLFGRRHATEGAHLYGW